MAAQQKKAAPADRADGWISVQTREGEMWRCGMKWTTQPRVESVEVLGGEVVDRLKAEPRLIVQDVPAPAAV